MRKLSTFIGLSLFALAATASAQEAAPAAATKAAPAVPAAAPASPVPAAANVAAAPAPAQPTTSRRKLQIGLSFLPMALGKYTWARNGMNTTENAPFAYGLGISVGYQVLPGLTLGVAPQAIFDVRTKPAEAEEFGPPTGKQFDLMARVAYQYQVVDTIGVYAEFLPGYSLLKAGETAKGLVLGFGAGVSMDLTDRFFANLGVGYQLGFQKVALANSKVDQSTRFARVALGGGVKL